MNYLTAMYMNKNGFYYAITSFWLVQNLSEEGFPTSGNDNNKG